MLAVRSDVLQSWGIDRTPTTLLMKGGEIVGGWSGVVHAGIIKEAMRIARQ